ncbi:hypothetical protein HKX48_008490 [Thoreauomyces humboldtii]|nr:hypothetical protein HKX48_008490 [Thoreauomyces humboldtii]
MASTCFLCCCRNSHPQRIRRIRRSSNNLGELASSNSILPYDETSTQLHGESHHHRDDRIFEGITGFTRTGVTIHHPTIAPKDDPLKHNAEYVATERAGITKGDLERHVEDDVEEDAIASAINSIVPQTDDPTEVACTFRIFRRFVIWPREMIWPQQLLRTGPLCIVLASRRRPGR